MGISREDLRAELKRFATKEDLKRFATKEDLKRFATKEDLKQFPTRKDLDRFVTHSQLQKSLNEWAAKITTDIVRETRVLLEALEADLRALVEGVDVRDRVSTLEQEVADLDTRVSDTELKVRALEERPQGENGSHSGLPGG